MLRIFRSESASAVYVIISFYSTLILWQMMIYLLICSLLYIAVIQ
jgi:hypothetical protein